MNCALLKLNILFCLLVVATPRSHRQSEANKEVRLTRSIEDEYPECTCDWSKWMNNDDYNPSTGDDNSYENLKRNYNFCSSPRAVECRNSWNPNIPFDFVRQNGVECAVTSGLLCVSRPAVRGETKPEDSFYCHDYEVRVLCCDCPQATSPSAAYVQITSQSSNMSLEEKGLSQIKAYTVAGIVPKPEESVDIVLPLSIIIAIIVGAIIIFGIIVYIVTNGVGHKQTKHSRVYMKGATYTQRPVSFTDFDRRSSSSSSSIGMSSSSGESYPSSKLTQLDKGKLYFMQSDEQAPEADVTNISSRHDAFIETAPEQRRWLPDEYELSLEKQGAKSAKKTVFS